MITVTKTFFPPIEEYHKQTQRIWDNKWLTNNGELCKELTSKLKSYLGVEQMILMTNGTLPIQIALNAFGNEGEVITTPFSYVATTSAIVWEKCTPVFVDIHPDYLTIDETKIEAAITEKTSAILATHVYGNPCDVEAIERIAKKHNLKVIYDAAHSFGVTYKGKSMFNYGDVSTSSFHATKLFHTGEGGALFCNDEALFHQMHFRHNFGHDGKIDFHGVGINAKMSELQAAMGLCVLPYMGQIISNRKRICDYYDKHLNFEKLQSLKIRPETQWNYAYYPIFFESEDKLLEVERILNDNAILPRRYFCPSLNTLTYLNREDKCPVSESIALRVICLPLYFGLEDKELRKIVELVNKVV
ncbi:DegT/DnrJ/EryC1/StrS family aminotransferase [Psychroserpens sp.]|uniref:DegT/DnrJ/EryC1/StrS family aminotransferase n=1 Tax=Psychroserpens sp. TaxID=2020870 RepID=UPI00385CCD61